MRKLALALGVAIAVAGCGSSHKVAATREAMSIPNPGCLASTKCENLQVTLEIAFVSPATFAAIRNGSNEKVSFDGVVCRVGHGWLPFTCTVDFWVGSQTMLSVEKCDAGANCQLQGRNNANGGFIYENGHH